MKLLQKPEPSLGELQALLQRRRRSDASNPHRHFSKKTGGSKRRQTRTNLTSGPRNRITDGPVLLPAVHEALDRLKSEDPTKAEVVQLVFLPA